MTCASLPVTVSFIGRTFQKKPVQKNGFCPTGRRGTDIGAFERQLDGEELFYDGFQ
jgi:hypothetical protein